jgi:RNAse (barnase) inhibitor barstar
MTSRNAKDDMNRSATRLIRLDVSSVSTKDSLQDLVCSAFGFPSNYGRDWGAFDDCIRRISTPLEILLEGFPALESVMPGEAAIFRARLDGFVAELSSRGVVLNVAQQTHAASRDT